MFTVENSILLATPLARVWGVLIDVDRYRDWHPHMRLKSDPADPRKLLYTHSRPGWTDPVISAQARIVRLKRPSDFAWRMGVKGLLELEEAFHLKKSPGGTRLTHSLCWSGIGSWLGFVIIPVLRRRLVRTGGSLERHLRKGTVMSRYAHRNARNH